MVRNGDVRSDTGGSEVSNSTGLGSQSLRLPSLLRISAPMIGSHGHTNKLSQTTDGRARISTCTTYWVGWLRAGRGCPTMPFPKRKL
jgi:hypothetical protein